MKAFIKFWKIDVALLTAPRFQCKTGNRFDFLRKLPKLRSFTRRIRKEKGCLGYNVYRDIEKENNYSVIGSWRTRPAMEKHFKTLNSELLTCRKFWCNTNVCGRANNTGFLANRSEFNFLFFIGSITKTKGVDISFIGVIIPFFIDRVASWIYA